MIRKITLLIMMMAIVLTGCAKQSYEPSGSDAPSEAVEEKHVETYCFFGVDSRNEDKKGNSDVVMLVRLDHDKKDAKVISVYRDTLMDTGGITKCNAAYAYGGAFYAVDTLEKNLDIDIRGYAAADFSSAIRIIDALGGVDIETTDEEKYYANRYVREMNELYDTSVPDITGDHLNGTQAVAYSRVRYTEGWDFKRTERQRTVLSLVAEKIRSADKSKQEEIFAEIASNVYTNLNEDSMEKIAEALMNYDLTADQGFPVYKKGIHISGLGDCVMPTTLSDNVVWLHKYLYDEDYVPSETVKEISGEIEKLSE